LSLSAYALEKKRFGGSLIPSLVYGEIDRATGSLAGKV
jgi:hypothetical protein